MRRPKLPKQRSIFRRSRWRSVSAIILNISFIAAAALFLYFVIYIEAQWQTALPGMNGTVRSSPKCVAQ